MGQKRRERWLTRDQIDTLLLGQIHGRNATEREIEETKERVRWIDWWDKNNPTGEGFTNLGILYQWVRVTGDNGKVLGTFYLKQSDDELIELFLVTPRKGLPPNPYDETFLSRVKWVGERVEMRKPVCADPEKGLDSRRGWSDSETILGQSGLWDAHRNHEQRPVLGVVPVPAKDEDTRFKFQAGADSFTVRGSILGKVLLGLRRAGKQHVSLDLVKRAVRHVNQ
ncbi:hypothetical protein ACOJAM_08615 [Corynebacterium striatum]|uniref:hypothetical protein n=1 Tax=Corynebacterium striatum TaxID=43770 RepID=UPI003B59816C